MNINDVIYKAGDVLIQLDFDGKKNTRLSSFYTKEQWKQNFWFWDKPIYGNVCWTGHPQVYFHPQRVND